MIVRAAFRRFLTPGAQSTIAGEREGAAWLIEKLGAGLYRLTLEYASGRVAIHVGTPAAIAARLGIDGLPRNRTAILDDITGVG